MCCHDKFIELFKNSSFIIQKNDTNKGAVQQLQTILYYLGFGKTLKWDQYGADGDYGNLTTKTVKEFCKKNNIESDGKTVDQSIASLLVKRSYSLDELQLLKKYLENDELVTILYQKSPKKEAVQALQVLLNELGYGKQLKWDLYKSDGQYGNATTSAVIAFAKDNDIVSNGTSVTKKLGLLIIKKLSYYYGKDWFLHPISELVNDQTNPLVEFTASHFSGKLVIADKDFIPHLNRINEYAKKHQIKIYVTSSFRKTSVVPGAIVTPAKMSNHMIGHAIDMNIQYGDNFNSWCNSSCLSKTTLPEPVAAFIQEIRNDDTLRWGGDFTKKDSVHIDDHYNKDAGKWKTKHDQIQQSL